MPGSLPAGGKTVSREAIYRWIYALPRGELAREGILPRSRRTARKRRRPLGERTGGRIVGMVSIDDRDPDVAGRRVPGAWEGDLERHEAPCNRAEVKGLRRCAVAAG
jgi:IS30 family transposase